MKVMGTERRHIAVDISSRKVVEQLFDDWKQRCIGQSGEDIYIKADTWVAYDDCRGQGSGLTTTIRLASQDEIQLNDAFRLILSQLNFKD